MVNFPKLTKLTLFGGKYHFTQAQLNDFLTKKIKGDIKLQLKYLKLSSFSNDDDDAFTRELMLSVG